MVFSVVDAAVRARRILNGCVECERDVMEIVASGYRVEQVTLGWLRQWLGLDDRWFGIIYDTASISVMQSIGAAREWIAPECRTQGMQPGLTVYVSEHTHTSAEKAAITLGFGQDNVRRVPVDNEFRMRPGFGASNSGGLGCRQAALLHCGVCWVNVGCGS